MDDARTNGPAPELRGLKSSPCDLLGPAIIAVDRERRISAFNPAAEALTQLSASRVLHNDLHVLPPPLEAVISETFDSGQSVIDRYLELTYPEGSSSVVNATTTPLARAEGAVPGVIAVVTHVLSGEKLEYDLGRLNRLASIGTASLSLVHELRNAFVAVNTFVQKLLEREVDSEFTPIVARELQRIDSIVRQMLTAARPRKPDGPPVSVHQCIQHALQLIAPESAPRGILVQESLKARADWVQGDAFQLEQAFYNLFANSIAAMSGGGTLSVSTVNTTASSSRASATLQIVIEDTGTGILPTDMPRLFSPFFTTKPDGTGLGLAITRRVIEEHRGHIRVSSQFGKGTRIEIVLPDAKPVGGEA